MEQVDSSVVGKEDPPCEAIKQLAIGDIRPREDEITKMVVPQAANEQSSTDVPDAEVEPTPATNQQSGSASHKNSSATLPLTAAGSPTLI